MLSINRLSVIKWTPSSRTKRGLITSTPVSIISIIKIMFWWVYSQLKALLSRYTALPAAALRAVVDSAFRFGRFQGEGNDAVQARDVVVAAGLIGQESHNVTAGCQNALEKRWTHDDLRCCLNGHDGRSLLE